MHVSVQSYPPLRWRLLGWTALGPLSALPSAAALPFHQENLAYSICSGPLQVVYGLILAIVGTLICSCTRFWNNRFKRAAALWFTGALNK